MYKINFLGYLLILSFSFTAPWSYAFNFHLPIIDQQKILANAPRLDRQALEYAIKGYHWALQNHHVNNPNILTVINFNLPSYEKRVWVINLNTSKILMNTFTTQGKNSGLFSATRFSNQARTNETSLGVYKTLDTYYGKHGLSERLQGLEQGLNNNAYSRAIVIHPAWYASSRFIAMYHRAGSSWGCFGIDPSVSEKFVDLTKGGSIIFAYASAEKRDYRLLLS